MLKTNTRIADKLTDPVRNGHLSILQKTYQTSFNLIESVLPNSIFIVYVLYPNFEENFIRFEGTAQKIQHFSRFGEIPETLRKTIGL